MSLHTTPHPKASQSVALKPNVLHPTFGQIGGSQVVIQDWYDRKVAGVWANMTSRDFAARLYAHREKKQKLPADDEVVLVKLGGFNVLIHVTEIAEEEA